MEDCIYNSKEDIWEPESLVKERQAYNCLNSISRLENQYFLSKVLTIASYGTLGYMFHETNNLLECYNPVVNMSLSTIAWSTFVSSFLNFLNLKDKRTLPQ